MSDPSFDAVEPTTPGIETPVASAETANSVGRGRRSVRLVGSGLRAWEFVLILAISTVAFLFWGGPLWDAPVGTSHVWRIGGSYLIVIPLVLAALARAHRMSFAHFLGAVGMAWSAKMLITATLYAYVAPQSATQYAPAKTWEAPAEAEAFDKAKHAGRAPVTEGGSGDVVGVVVANDGRQASPVAAVIVEDLPESAFARPPAHLAIAIEHARYGQTVYLAGSQDRVVLSNRDASLHTLRITDGQRALANIPVPAGSGEHFIATPPPGRYLLSCENHESEQALLLVVGHPFYTLADSNGRFELLGLPAGEHIIAIWRNGRVPSRRAVTVTPSSRLELSIDVR